MDTIRLSATECNYKEIDRQLKKQFIDRLNYNDMLVEIKRQLTNTEEYKDVTSEQVLAWEKGVEAQKVPS